MRARASTRALAAGASKSQRELAPASRTAQLGLPSAACICRTVGVASHACQTVRCWRTSVVGELGDLAAADDAALVEDAELARRRGAQTAVSAPPAARSCPASRLRRMMMSPISCDDVGLDAFGRLVEDQQLRVEHQARPIASCCCWPPDRSPPRRLQHLLEHRKHLEDRARARRALVPRRAPKPDAQILLDGELRKDLAALRHVADAQRARALRAACDRAARRRRSVIVAAMRSATGP